MKTILASVSALLLASSVKAGFGFGGCPAVSSIAYPADMVNAHDHRLLYVDGMVNWGLGMAKMVMGNMVPDLSCFSMIDIDQNSGTFGQSSYGYDNTAYTTQFEGTSVAYYTKLLYFDSATGTEVHYGCLDKARADLLIDFAVAQGIPLPASVLKIFTNLLTFLHIDGVAVLSGGNSVDSTVE